MYAWVCGIFISIIEILFREKWSQTHLLTFSRGVLGNWCLTTTKMFGDKKFWDTSCYVVMIMVVYDGGAWIAILETRCHLLREEKCESGLPSNYCELWLFNLDVRINRSMSTKINHRLKTHPPNSQLFLYQVSLQNSSEWSLSLIPISNPDFVSSRALWGRKREKKYPRGPFSP